MGVDMKESSMMCDEDLFLNVKNLPPGFVTPCVALSRGVGVQ